MNGACSEHLDELIEDFLEEYQQPPNLLHAENVGEPCKYCARAAQYLVTACE